MTRFEIQDIVSQNQDGVTFRALDTKTEQIVSLRRFFPFGQGDEEDEGGVGLEPDEGKAFSSACERLAKIQHPALRKTIFGNTDPIDGMPFLVTEWIDGESLADVLGNNTMEPSMIIGLVRQALDVCMILSETLKNEAVWIDTKLESIIVSNSSEVPSFSFRICPFKWLGTQSHQKDLTGIVSLVEALMGWKTKLISDQAGLGLGGWIKLLRQNPQMPLAKALETLPSPSISPVAPASTTPTSAPVQQPFIITKAEPAFFNKKSITIMAVSACITGLLIFLLYQKNLKDNNTSTQNPPAEQSVIPIPTETPEAVKTPEPQTPLVEPQTPIDEPKTPTDEPKTPTDEPKTPVDEPKTTPDEPKTPVDEPKTPVDEPKTPVDEPKTTPDEPKTPLDKPSDSPANTQVNPPKVDYSLPIPARYSPAAWFDATDPDSITQDNGLVSQWADKSGNNRHASHDKSRLQPSAGGSINGKNAIKFPGVLLTSFPQLTTTSIYLVVDANPQGRRDDNCPFGATNKAGAGGAYISMQNVQNGTAQHLPSYGKNIDNHYLNGAYQASNHGFNPCIISHHGTSLSTEGLNYRIGTSRTDNKNNYSGTIGEILIFDTEHDQSTRQVIEGYLAHKWGLAGSLPADHPYKSLSPAHTPDVLTPQNTAFIKNIKDGDPVTLQGTVRSAKFSSTEKSIYLSFSDPEVETDIRVVIHGNDYVGGPFTEKGFAPLIGKNLVFKGTVYRERFNDRPPFVKITRKDQVSLATSESPQTVKPPDDNSPKPEPSGALPIFSPDDHVAIAKLEPAAPASVKGVVRKVMKPKKSNGLYINFSDPWDGNQIRVVAYMSNFEGKQNTAEEFKKLETDLQRLVGKTVLFEGLVVTHAGQARPHFIRINTLSQIKEVE